jgi:hypothetical protein
MALGVLLPAWAAVTAIAARIAIVAETILTYRIRTSARKKEPKVCASSTLVPARKT